MIDFTRRRLPRGAHVRRLEFALGLALVSAHLVQPIPLAGQQKPPVEPAVDSLDEARQLLAATERSQVQQGIEALGMDGTEAATLLLVERVRLGLPPDLLDMALDTLQVLGGQAAADMLRELSTHRRTAVRRRAMEALGAISSPETAATLVTGLSDAERGVRGAAANALGDLGDPTTQEPLFQALERGVIEASAALGHVVSAANLHRLTDYLGRLAFHDVAPALMTALERDDLSADSKLRVITQIGELATPEAKGLLQHVAASIPNPSDRLRRAAEAAATPIR